MSDDDVFTAKIPHDLKPRVLDWLSTNETLRQLRPMLHKSQHFALGIDASQHFMLFAGDELKDVREDIQEFAPHPFDHYTVSYWLNDDQGNMIECLIAVFPNPYGSPVAGQWVLRWGENEMFNAAGCAVPREVAFGEQPSPGDVLRDVKAAEATWKMLDVFRLMLTRPGITINKGAAPRHSVRKGKRVTFYSASQITIDLDAVRRPKVDHHTGHGRAVAAYQYRAHLCHSRLKPGCVHHWQADEPKEGEEHLEPRRWTCTACDGKRWHRKAGQRGDASIGFIKQTWKVKKGKNDNLPTDAAR